MTTPAVVVEPDLEKAKRKKSKGKESHDAAPGKAGWFTYAALALIVFLWVVPTIGILLTSFRSSGRPGRGWVVEPLPAPLDHRQPDDRELQGSHQRHQPR